jgi:Type III flagellar switch regulator (C-ring) FliN C-term
LPQAISCVSLTPSTTNPNCRSSACSTTMFRASSGYLLDGGTIGARSLEDLEAGNVLLFDHPVERPIKATLNGIEKWTGRIAVQKEKLAFQALERIESKT